MRRAVLNAVQSVFDQKPVLRNQRGPIGIMGNADDSGVDVVLTLFSQVGFLLHKKPETQIFTVS